jgi:hypothetical protein
VLTTPHRAEIEALAEDVQTSYPSARVRCELAVHPQHGVLSQLGPPEARNRRVSLVDEATALKQHVPAEADAGGEALSDVACRQAVYGGHLDAACLSSKRPMAPCSARRASHAVATSRVSSGRSSSSLLIASIRSPGPSGSGAHRTNALYRRGLKYGTRHFVPGPALRWSVRGSRHRYDDSVAALIGVGLRFYPFRKGACRAGLAIVCSHVNPPAP